jgi:hypothetical protein
MSTSLSNYVQSRWQPATGRTQSLHDAITGEVIATAGSERL